MPERDDRSRGEQVADWVGWHLVELVAVGVPVVLALTVAAWLIAVSALAGAVWATAEVRAARRGRARLAAGARQQLAPAGEGQGDERDEHQGESEVAGR